MATSTAHADLLVGDHTARDARAVALAVVEAWECEVSVETLLLVLDELVDAVRERASTEYGLVLELSTHDAQGVRVTLADGSAVRATAEDVVRGAPVLAALLSSLTARWGDEPYRGGYSLWFDLVADGPAPPTRVAALGRARRRPRRRGVPAAAAWGRTLRAPDRRPGRRRAAVRVVRRGRGPLAGAGRERAGGVRPHAAPTTHFGSSTKTGISRSVFSWYSAYDG